MWVLVILGATAAEMDGKKNSPSTDSKAKEHDSGKIPDRDDAEDKGGSAAAN